MVLFLFKVFGYPTGPQHRATPCSTVLVWGKGRARVGHGCTRWLIKPSLCTTAFSNGYLKAVSLEILGPGRSGPLRSLGLVLHTKLHEQSTLQTDSEAMS